MDIFNADLEIQRLWQDWDFMVGTFLSTTATNSRHLKDAIPAHLGAWDVKTFWTNFGLVDSRQLGELDWETFHRVVLSKPANVNEPVNFAIDRLRQVYLDPISFVETPFQADYWKHAIEMEGDEAQSLIPHEFHRIIIARAKMYYAEREDAPEIMVAANAEYSEMLTSMESKHLPGQKNSGRGSASTPGVVRPV